jgi:hypothetical protein
MYSRLAVSYSSLETARQPSRKGGCCPLAGEGVNAIRSAPMGKKRKKVSDLRNVLISSLPTLVGRTSRPVFEKEPVVRGEGDERAATSRGRFLLKPRCGFQSDHENLCQHSDHRWIKTVEHLTLVRYAFSS